MRKRSKYKPKGVRLDTMGFVLEGMKKFDEIDVAVNLRIKNHLAMECLRLGKATKSDISTLIDCFNMTEGLCRFHKELGGDWSKEIRAGQDAMFAMSSRGVESDRFICKPSELVAMNLVMEIHDSQLSSCTVKDLEMAMNIVVEDFRNKRMRAIVV